MRPEKLYLTDIVEAAQAIERFIMGESFEEFERNEMMNSAVLQKLTIIGEAASRLPKEFTKRFPEIPWADIVAFRNIAIHEYFAIRWDIAWNAATEDVPMLKGQIEKLLREELAD
ncbi:MAG TPA: HepT-like ribonuclease domain-containing protein [Anaerolineales bacterium]|nr:HepT-like ribonuclease domain-containing protein [Anaerolineales bacterium]